MSMEYSCDYCGEPITDDRLMVEIRASGTTYDPDRYHNERWVSGDLGHYHATEDRCCWAEMVDRIRLIHAVSSDLGPDREALERRIEQRSARQREQEERDERERDHRERVRAWRRIPQSERDELLLRALGDERLTPRELMARLNAELDAPEDGHPTVYDSTVVSMAKRMLRDGQLEREPETFNKTHLRYRYFRKRLDGPIADLERAYNDDDEPVA